MEQEFLGSGMKFPPQVNPATGRFVVSSGRESVRESVYLILMTQKTERFVRPDFGSSLMSYTFMDTGTTILNMMAREVANDIMSQEPRISDIETSIEPSPKAGCLIIRLQYVIRDGNVRENLVFPFYLDSDWGEEESNEAG